MNDNFDDSVTDLKQTDSQKTVSTSNEFSLGSTDEVSEKLNSSGMETYVLDIDSEEYVGTEHSALNSTPSLRATPKTLINRDVQCEAFGDHKATAISKCSIFAQETFTQTSKTIVQLAEIDAALRKVHNKSLETQTSFLSITENKTIEYRIEMTENTVSTNQITHSITEIRDDDPYRNFEEAALNMLVAGTVQIDSFSDNNSIFHQDSKVIEYKENTSERNSYDNNSDYEEDLSDLEDSLMLPTPQPHSAREDDAMCTPKSVDMDVAELYDKLYECMEFESQSSIDPDQKHYRVLSPLTEESATKKATSVDDATDNAAHSEKDSDVLFTNKAGVKIKMLQDFGRETENIKLPPIQSSLSPLNLDFLFGTTSNSNDKSASSKLPRVYEEQRENPFNRWELGSKCLASGESRNVNSRSDADRTPLECIQLPPIKGEGFPVSKPKSQHSVPKIVKAESTLGITKSPISINEKIKELKMNQRKYSSSSKISSPRYTDSRSGSPVTESRMMDIAERGSEVLCVELIKRLRSQTWYEVTETLEEIPRVMDKFWHVISETRIADLIRCVACHLESPRAQVARTACHTMAVILKNTNYTKKPDFYEAMTVLLVKTGSFSRPVRRAANMALDDIVCSVDLIHTITALCVHGTNHKSMLVRCAAARLLVVCCALGAGGRELLRARPPSAAAARSHTLRALSLLLDDKNTDTRKYAERLYLMLRPLTDFEAYYLTDVDVDVAARQMKKYDQLLLSIPPEGR